VRRFDRVEFVRKAREIGAPQTQLGHIASPPARRDSRKCPKSQKVPGDYAKLEFAKTLNLHVFSQLHGCYALADARIVSNAVWNARAATGVLEMIHMGKGWMEGG
jgi:hypothetical protein